MTDPRIIDVLKAALRALEASDPRIPFADAARDHAEALLLVREALGLERGRVHKGASYADLREGDRVRQRQESGGYRYGVVAVAVGNLYVIPDDPSTPCRNKRAIPWELDPHGGPRGGTAILPVEIPNPVRIVPAAAPDAAPEWARSGHSPPGDGTASYRYMGDGLWVRQDVPTERWKAIVDEATRAREEERAPRRPAK